MSPLERDALEQALASLPDVAPSGTRAGAVRLRCRARLERERARRARRAALRFRQLAPGLRLLARRGHRALEAIVHRARGVGVRDEQPLPRRL